MGEVEVTKKSRSRFRLGLTLLIVAIILGSIVSGLLIIPRPVVGVIKISGELGADSSDQIVKMIDYAKTNGNIKAVVLKIDSPGGDAASVQEVYMSLLKLKEAKPIVAWMGSQGVSGAYYIAVSANYIYATPASWVGNIGALVVWPYADKIPPHEELIETGPFKHTGFSRRDIVRNLNTLLVDFLDAVTTHRTQLELNRTELSKALIYTGAEAAQYGLIDAVGSYLDAVEKAANLAGIAAYQVEEINELFESSSDKESASLNGIAPGYYYLYAPQVPESTYETYSDLNKSSTSSYGGGVVLIDLFHNNNFDREELNMLLKEIVSNDYAVRYVEDSWSLSIDLLTADSFVVISPQSPFSEYEIETVKSFVSWGGKLLLIQDPTRGDSGNINTLAADFGVVFANGYLYNLEENDGNYRYIFVDRFEESGVTKDLEKLVFYTACHIYSSGDEIGYTSDSTYSSTSGVKKAYAPMILAFHDRVFAVGDQTFLTEPYCYTLDNYKFVSNVADYLTTGYF